MSHTASIEVSVIVPAYNARAFIARALDSALAQTFSGIEVIVVDDASQDGTADFVEMTYCGDPRLRLVRRDENGGPASARNLAIGQARGEWIAILDADDAWHPQRLERMLTRANDVDAVFDNLAGIDAQTGECIARLFPDFPDGTLPVDRLLAPHASRGQFDFGYLKPLLRRAFLTHHGLVYDETLRTSEDLLFYLTLLLSGARTQTIDQALYLYTLPAGLAGNARSPHSRTRPRDREVESALRRLTARYAAQIDDTTAQLLEQRMTHLRHIAPIAEFYHARQTRAYGRMALLMARYVSVRREVMSKALVRLSR